MIGRTLEAVRRRVGEPAERSPRPNELRRDVARAERLRREALRIEAAASQPRHPPEELRGQQGREAGGPAVRGGGEPRLAAALMSRSGLRQAWLVTEILGPPRALRGPHAGRPEA